MAPPQGDEPGIVAMDVTMSELKLRTISGAIGYGSEEGIRVQAAWEHRNLFPPEGALRLRGSWERVNSLRALPSARTTLVGVTRC